MLATAAMVVRNAVLLLLLSPQALRSSVLALALMLAACMGVTARRLLLVRSPLMLLDSEPGSQQAEDAPPALNFESPFSLKSALKFGLIFLALQIGAVLAQQLLGQLGFYAVSVVGGLISSASAVATAATLATHGTLSAHVAGTGAVLASIASALVNLPLIARLSHEHRLTQQLAIALGLVVLLGLVGTVFAIR